MLLQRLGEVVDLLHDLGQIISQLDDGFVREVADVCKIGDRIKVKVLSVENNKVRLSRKAALKETKPD